MTRNRNNKNAQEEKNKKYDKVRNGRAQTQKKCGPGGPLPEVWGNGGVGGAQTQKKSGLEGWGPGGLGDAVWGPERWGPEGGGCRVKPWPLGPPFFFTRQPENSKHAHLRVPALQTPQKFHEKTHGERKKEGKKTTRHFGGPAVGSPVGGPAEGGPSQGVW